jgi:hypothetical protein
MLLQGIGSAVVGAPVRLPEPPGVTPAHVRCVIGAFRDRAGTMRRQLMGDALSESNLSPEEHIAIQEALARKGFMQNRVKSYGAKPPHAARSIGAAAQTGWPRATCLVTDYPAEWPPWFPVPETQVSALDGSP